jgi:hypothetical protein
MASSARFDEPAQRWAADRRTAALSTLAQQAQYRRIQNGNRFQGGYTEPAKNDYKFEEDAIVRWEESEKARIEANYLQDITARRQALEKTHAERAAAAAARAAAYAAEEQRIKTAEATKEQRIKASKDHARRLLAAEIARETLTLNTQKDDEIARLKAELATTKAELAAARQELDATRPRVGRATPALAALLGH